MVDRSNEVERLKAHLKLEDKTKAQIMAIPDHVTMDQLEFILEGEDIDMNDSELFIFRHDEMSQLLEDDEIPAKIKRIIRRSYDDAKDEFHRAERLKETLKEAEEIKALVEDGNEDDARTDVLMIKNLFKLAAHVGPDLFDYDDETCDAAHVIRSTIKALDVCPFLEAFPIAMTSVLRSLSEDENTKSNRVFLKNSDGKKYLYDMEDCTTTTLAYLMSAFEKDPQLSEHIKTYQDMVVLFSMLIAKTLQTETLIEVLFKEKIQDEAKTSKKKPADIIPFTTDTDQIN